jgi:hypothetical protein
MRERLRHQRERRRMIESSRWWRFRPRLPRALFRRRAPSTRGRE